MQQRKKRMFWIAAVSFSVFAGAVGIYWGVGHQESDRSTSEPSSESSYSLNIDLNHRGTKISPTLYGAFYEEINHAGDGGIYAELLPNRSFEDQADHPDYWWIEEYGGAKGSLALTDRELLNSSQNRALEFVVHEAVEGGKVSLINYGYWGIPLVKGGQYKLSLFARRGSDFSGPLEIAFESANGKQKFASAEIRELESEWMRYELALTSSETVGNARLAISADREGQVFLDMVSLFPETWKDRENGLRKDLAGLVADMSPTFLRFPGGCFVEGNTPENAYRWKTTIGTVEERPGHQGYWNYRSTDGLGFHELLQWAEDLNAEPLYVAYVGISHDGDPFARANYDPLENMDVWVQDALDAIEYANGPATSYWGAKRAANGHPEPFNLRYIEVGNENNFQLTEYAKRYAVFYQAIKEKYPDIHVIANAFLDNAPVEIVDEHYYESAQWFMDHSDMYDSYDRNGPKIYVGEYAVTKNAGKGNMEAALGEAAFMTGMERNSDVVVMSSYAPLLVNDKDRTWNPDAIVFNAEASYGTPSYHVQSMFAGNTGDVLVHSTLEKKDKTEANLPIQGAVGVGAWATQVEYRSIKVTADGKNLLQNENSDWAFSGGDWSSESGVLKQSSNDVDVRAVTGDSSWNNYTLSLQARKTGGSEGMLIMFGSKDRDNYYWWNLGGWGNTQTAIEKSTAGSKSVIGQVSPVKIESHRWYDIKIELEGSIIRAYLDGELIHEIHDAPKTGPLFHTASIDEQTGDLIVKVVNVSDSEQSTDFNIQGTPARKGWKGTVTCLQAEEPTDENSFFDPTKITPAKSDLTFQNNFFQYAFPKYSVTILRIKATE